MKKTIFWFFKAALGALLAFAVLTGFCMFYYNMPVHHDTEDGATDYAWDQNRFSMIATEGFFRGRTNNEGYINSFDYTPGDPVDVLVMGSSHMEALQVGMDQSTAAVLGKLLPDAAVYNIGMSAHNFLVCADNFTAAINKYKPSGYVLLETSLLRYTDEQLLSAIDETVPHLPSYSDGIIGLLQKNPFLRLLYLQFDNFSENADSAAAPAAEQLHTTAREALYDALLTKLQTTAAQNGAQLIIVYHPHLQINEDNSISVLDDGDFAGFFAEACARNQVEFLDMTETFIQNFKDNHVLPHGFANSSVGSGHLNKYGHAMIAEAACELIRKEEF